MIIHKGNLDKWFFDYFEGNLSSHEILELKEYLDANPSAHADFEAWKETYATAEAKKKSKKIPVYAGASGLMVEAGLMSRINWNVAAVIALLFASVSTIGYFTFSDSKLSENNSNALSTLNLNGESKQSNIEEAERLNELSSEDIYYKNQEKKAELAKHEEFKQNVTSSDNSMLPTSVLHSNTSLTSSYTLNQPQFNNSEINSEDVNQDHVQLIETEKVKIKPAFPFLSATNNQLVDSSFDNNLNKSLPSVEHEETNDKYNFLDFSAVANNAFHSSNSSKSRPSEKRKLEYSEDVNLSDNNQAKVKNSEKANKRKRTSLGDLELSLYNVHDPIFVKSYQLPLQNNYALAGNLGLTRMKMSYRDQFRNSFSENTSITAASDWYMNKIKAGIGLNYTQSSFTNGAGGFENIGLTYSQKIKIDRIKSFSVAAHYDYNKINVSGSHSGSQLYLNNGEKVLISNDRPIQIVNNNLALSGWYDGQFFYGGFTVNNLLFSKNTLSNLFTDESHRTVDYSVQVGTDYKKMAYSNLVVSPQLIYQKHSKTHEMWLGTTVKYYWLVGGASFSTQHTGKVMAGVQNSKFRLLYGYDLNNSSIENGLYNSHELSLRVLLGTKKANWSRY